LVGAELRASADIPPQELRSTWTPETDVNALSEKPKGRCMSPDSILAEVRSAVEEAVGYSVDDDASLMEQGLDSIAAMELQQSLRTRTGQDVDPEVAFSNPTIRALAEHLSSDSQKEHWEDDDALTKYRSLTQSTAGAEALPPLVMVSPTFPDASAAFSGYISALAPKGEVLLSGHAQRDKAKHLHELAERHSNDLAGRDRAFLLGASIGGVVAAETALISQNKEGFSSPALLFDTCARGTFACFALSSYDFDQ